MPYIKFQDSSVRGSLVSQLPKSVTDRQTDRRTDGQTDGQAQTNMPPQLLRSWGHKKSFLFFNLIVLAVSLKIWELLFKVRICSPREQILSFKSSPPMGREIGLDYLMRKYIFFPLEQNE